jgi:hypothetical protein
MFAREPQEEPMKSSFSKKMSGIAIVFLLVFFIFVMMPSSSGEALESGGRVSTRGFGPGTMILLGGALIGVAGLARRKYGRTDKVF